MLHKSLGFCKLFDYRTSLLYTLRIKKNYEEKKNFLNQYEKNIAELKDKIVELRYDYDVLKGESILSNSKKSSVTESRSVIKNLEKSKKSIFSSIPSEESAWNFSFTNSDFNNLFDFFA